jgi:DNA-binding LacI/PurR family transcriptional regulator
MPTMRDIARAASVSLGSVSNDFNNPDLVPEDTPLAISQAGYHPNAAARSLKTNQTLRPGLAPLISLEDNYSLDPGETAFLAFLSGSHLRRPGSAGLRTPDGRAPGGRPR